MNFIIQKLKNKHTFLKKLQNWAKLNSLFWGNKRRQKPDVSHPHLDSGLKIWVNFIEKSDLSWFIGASNCFSNWFDTWTSHRKRNISRSCGAFDGICPLFSGYFNAGKYIFTIFYILKLIVSMPTIVELARADSTEFKFVPKNNYLAKISCQNQGTF